MHIFIIATIAADNENLGLLLHQSGGAQQEIWTLEWIEPPGKEQYRRVQGQAKLLAHLLTGMGNKELEIDTAWDHLNAVGRGTTETRYLRALVRSRRDNTVHLLDEPLLHLQALRWLQRIGMSKHLQARKRVEHRNVRHIPLPRQLFSDNAGEPVMAMHHVVGDMASKRLYVASKEGKILSEIVFVNRCNGSGLDMYDAYVAAQLDNLGCGFIRPTGKNVDSSMVMRKRFR